MNSMTLFDRQVLIEVMQMLLVGTLAIIGIFFGTVEFQHALEMMGQVGMPIQTVLTIMMLQLPTGLAFCMPGGIVVASLLVLLRCSKENEVLAMQMVGTPTLRILVPFWVVGLISSALAFSVSEFLAPQSRDLSRRLFNVALYKTERPFPNQSEIRLEADDGVVTRIFELGKGCGSFVNGFVSFDLTQKDVVKLVWARSAEWKNQAWNLHDGKLFELSPESSSSDGSSPGANVQSQFASMQLPGTDHVSEFMADRFKTTLDKTTAELRADIELCKSFKEPPPPYLFFQYYRRYSHPLSCLFLVVAATPVVMMRRRKGRDFSLLYGGALVASFFFLQEVVIGMVGNGLIDPLVAAWVPGLLLMAVGLLLTLLLAKR